MHDRTRKHFPAIVSMTPFCYGPSNYLPINGTLQRDKARMLATVDKVLNTKAIDRESALPVMQETERKKPKTGRENRKYMITRIIINAARVLFGAVLLFSGFVKAVDPLGSMYKFQDFFTAFGVEWLFPAALPLAAGLSTVEFVVGFAFLAGVKMQVFAPLGLALMSVFAPATIYIALTDPVPHCGCFGDAIVISNQATATKNVLLFLASAVVFFYKDRIRPVFSAKSAVFSLFAATGLAAGLSVYALIFLPAIDFRPWKAGADIAALLEEPDFNAGKVYLVFENRETGETRVYPADDYPWDDPEWANLWKYRERTEKTARPDAASPIDNFSIMDEDGFDLTGQVIFAPGLLYMVVAYDLETANTRAFDQKLAPLSRQAENDGHDFIALTASLPDVVASFKEEHNARFPFFFSDERALKTIIRSNPGLVLIKDGVVVDKWPHTRMPSYGQIKNRYKE